MRVKNLFCIALVVLVLSCQLYAQSTATAFRFPLDIYEVGPNYFWAYGLVYSNKWHLGEDVEAKAEMPVYATANGVVKHAEYHPMTVVNGKEVKNYGGMYIIEHTLPTGEKVCAVYPHMNFASFTKSVGQAVVIGEYLGEVGTYAQNGGYLEHFHFGINKGAYNSYTSNGEWSYGGYTAYSSVKNNWYDPTDFIKSKSSSYLGKFSNGWHKYSAYSNNPSQPIFDAYNQFGGQSMFGNPYNNNGGTIYAHTWPASGNPADHTNVFVLQDFNKNGQIWHIIETTSRDAAYATHGKLAVKWWTNPTYYGAPRCNEYANNYAGNNEPSRRGHKFIVQLHTKHTIVYDDNNQDYGEWPVGRFAVDNGPVGSYCYELVSGDWIRWPNGWTTVPTGEWFMDTGSHTLKLTAPNGSPVGSFFGVCVTEGNHKNAILPATYEPQNLVITGVTQSSVSLSWQDGRNTGVTYKLFRTNSGATVEYATGIVGLSFTDNSVVTGQTYEYYVKASLNGEDSYPSNTVSTSIPTNTSNPCLQLSTNHLKFDSTQATKTFTGYNIGGGYLDEWNIQIRNGAKWFTCSPIGQGSGNFSATVAV